MNIFQRITSWFSRVSLNAQLNRADELAFPSPSQEEPKESSAVKTVTSPEEKSAWFEDLKDNADISAWRAAIQEHGVSSQPLVSAKHLLNFQNLYSQHYYIGPRDLQKAPMTALRWTLGVIHDPNVRRAALTALLEAGAIDESARQRQSKSPGQEGTALQKNMEEILDRHHEKALWSLTHSAQEDWLHLCL